jgi:hypothetical protein
MLVATDSAEDFVVPFVSFCSIDSLSYPKALYIDDKL